MKDYQLRRITWASILLLTGLLWASVIAIVMFSPMHSSSKEQNVASTKGK